MNMTTQIASMRIARDLHAFEAQLAATMAQASALSNTMTDARSQLGMPPWVGHNALVHFARVQEHLLKANGETARTHKQLLNTAQELEIGPEGTIHSDDLDVQTLAA